MACYGFAALCGLAFVTAYFPPRVALGIDTPDALLSGDIATHVAGQRYFVGDSWHWPPFLTRLLEAPHGVNIILTDSIPIAALVAKLVSPLLPHPVTFVPAWLALCYVLQPAAAVYALRGANERRRLPAACIAIMAICMPALLRRVGHTALCSHFLLLIAIGLYLRIQRDLRPRPVAMTLLLAGSLLIHAYLLVMVAAVLAAAPLSLLLRRELAWRGVAVGLVPGVLATAGAAVFLEFGGATPGDGYGQVSMNLLSPVYPAYSDLLRGVFAASLGPIDANGSQANNYQYLGFGLLLLIAIACILPGRERLARQLRRHAGLVLVCLALTAFAASNVVYLGHKLLIDLGPVPVFFHQLRASGRFFWPVSYVLLVGGVTMLLRALSYGAAASILALVTALQFLDTRTSRRTIGDAMKLPVPVVIDEARMHALLARHTRLTIWPSMECGISSATMPEFMATIIAASDTLVPINTFYKARGVANPDCDGAHTVGTPLAPGELRVFMPVAAMGAAFMVPDGERYCRALRDLSVCSLNEDALKGLPPANPPDMKLGTRLDAGTVGYASVLAAGWTMPPMAPGNWSQGGKAVIAGHLVPGPAGDVRVTLTGTGLTDAPDHLQHVTVAVHDKVVAQWAVEKEQVADYSAIVPLAAIHDGNLVLTLEIGHPVRPIDLKINGDTRPLGFFLEAIRTDPVAEGSSP